MTLLERFQSGDIRALARLISYVENREEHFRELLGKVYPRTGNSLRIGITGPPGAGKSTLVNGLARRFLQEGKSVGIVAVDPTSPFTGGALLGDRVRMQDFDPSEKIYFRSMATRGASGGLAAATDNVAVLLDAFGFDITLIETVGVGQVELDIIHACDVVVVVIVPESGDAVQMLKAGLMEIADVFCINKSDRPGSQRLAADLKYTLELRSTQIKPTKSFGGAHSMISTPAREPGGRPAIIQTVATAGENLERLHDEISSFVERGREKGTFEARRRHRLAVKITAILNNRFQSEFVNGMAGDREMQQAIDDIVDGRTDPFAVGDKLYEQFRAR